LPGGSVAGAQTGDKIGLEKAPAFGEFRPGDLAAFGLAAQGLGRHLQEGGGVLKVKSFVVHI
jgi:hypothetical protein